MSRTIDQTEEGAQQIDRLLKEFKNRGLPSALEAFSRHRLELIKAATESKIQKKKKVLSPFLYQLR
jgi:hypothetical protein